MGKNLVKLRNVDFLDSQRLLVIAPLGRWNTCSGFMASSSGHFIILVLDRDMCIFPAASTLRCARPLPYLDYLNQDQFMGIRNQMRCVSSMHMELEMFLSNENYVTKLNMLIFWNGQQGYNFTNS
ncbi:hypothetical protein IGI04_034928 [Brassica rapa subsp. trilocularis]|uniref:Uncharacterized protein n=1 Tax=Brassica rapa subsp. trilocularis TaxID=1813537 RepID=A0ABQ7LDA4_BRACM|nr:hypothetical protein IGI04_034928 [Brassica rapa subsp. trilocularis]